MEEQKKKKKKKKLNQFCLHRYTNLVKTSHNQWNQNGGECRHTIQRPIHLSPKHLDLSWLVVPCLEGCTHRDWVSKGTVSRRLFHWSSAVPWSKSGADLVLCLAPTSFFGQNSCIGSEGPAILFSGCRAELLERALM